MELHQHEEEITRNEDFTNTHFHEETWGIQQATGTLSLVLAAVHAEDVVMWHEPQVLVQRLARSLNHGQCRP